MTVRKKEIELKQVARRTGKRTTASEPWAKMGLARRHWRAWTALNKPGTNSHQKLQPWCENPEISSTSRGRRKGQPVPTRSGGLCAYALYSSTRYTSTYPTSSSEQIKKESAGQKCKVFRSRLGPSGWDQRSVMLFSICTSVCRGFTVAAI